MLVLAIRDIGYDLVMMATDGSASPQIIVMNYVHVYHVF